MSARDPLWPDIGSLALLLAPLPGSDPCGPSLRYDAVMGQLRSAREADDPSLPMGEWERPLKRADWPTVQTLCIELLAYRSKDLHAAAWLLDASVRLQQTQGLNTGILLLCGLVEQHWELIHPQIGDDGDSDARVAPLAWLNEALPLTLNLQLALLTLPGRKPAQMTLDDWERLLHAGPDADAVQTAGDEGLPPRGELLRLAGQPSSLAQLTAMREQLQQSVTHWSRLNALIDERLGRDAPSLGRVADALARLQRAVNQLIGGRDQAAVADTPARTARADGLLFDPTALHEAALSDEVQPRAAQAAVMASTVIRTASGPGLPTAGDPVLSLTSRESAYQALQAVADYLQSIEPHSPTPYLIRRAISWGAMPLPQLMQEVMREEGDLNRLFAVLGLPQPAR